MLCLASLLKQLPAGEALRSCLELDSVMAQLSPFVSLQLGGCHGMIVLLYHSVFLLAS